MKVRVLGAGVGVLLTAIGCLVFLGRNGEYAIPFTMPEPRTELITGRVHIQVVGGVIRESPREGPVRVWATRPEFSLRAEGVSPARPVILLNIAPASAYQPIRGIEEPWEGTSVTIARPGAYAFHLRPQESYSFLLMGDPRKYYDRLDSALAKAGDALFALCLGDLVSDGDPQEYAEVAAVAAESPVPVYFTIGNHHLEKGGRRHYRRLFGEENYAFTVGRDVFAVLDTAADYPYLGDHRLEWLGAQLSTPGTRHRFALFHTPPFDPRPGGDHALRYPLLRDGLREVLASNGVEYALAAHIHDYADGVDAGIPYVITGGLGANAEARFEPHVVRVSVEPGGISWQRVSVEEPLVRVFSGHSNRTTR